MVQLIISKDNYLEYDIKNNNEAYEAIVKATGLQPEEFYLEENGKRLIGNDEQRDSNGLIYFRLKVCGGKGGFGSMLRAIGAQIEKTTNREACRDLSGRRLRDINEEKRLKAWMNKQAEREQEAEERKKKKIEKLLAVPKHEFKDEQYEEARAKLTDKVNDAVEEGFKKAMEAEKDKASKPNDLKRKAEAEKAAAAKKKKMPALWIVDNLSDTSEDSDDSDDSDNSSGDSIEIVVSM